MQNTSLRRTRSCHRNSPPRDSARGLSMVLAALPPRVVSAAHFFIWTSAANHQPRHATARRVYERSEHTLRCRTSDRKAKQHILDTFAAMISGFRLALPVARPWSCTCLWAVRRSRRCRIQLVCGPSAAFANGVLAAFRTKPTTHMSLLLRIRESPLFPRLCRREQFSITGHISAGRHAWI